MIEVEFFGVCRQRTGVASASLPCPENGQTLSEILQLLANLYPQFASHCLEGNALQSGYVANIDGEKFIRMGDTQIQDRASVLFMSADAGG